MVNGGFMNMAQEGLQLRMANTRNTLQKTVENFRTLASDVKTRFDLSPNKEPTGGKLGGIFGSRGDLTESFASMPVREKDILAEHMQTMAGINRRWLTKK